ncbi:Transcription elongation factor A protein 2 [Varanus komodoensis]|nr:Transcription elongation factor A protein 2 [Varanus komodoensis]
MGGEEEIVRIAKRLDKMVAKKSASGFRPGYGTESALVALYDDLCREKDRRSASLLVLLDLSAAFDTIDHDILLDRLAGLGVGGTA